MRHKGVDVSLFGLQVVRSTSSQVNLFVPRPLILNRFIRNMRSIKFIPDEKILFVYFSSRNCDIDIFCL